MWSYEGITRADFEKYKDHVEALFVQYGARVTDLGKPQKMTTMNIEGIVDTIVNERNVYEYDGSYFRLDEVLFPNKPFVVFEWGDSLDIVEKNIMEDADPFPYGLSDKEIELEFRFMTNSVDEEE